jgi:hypothetical protein
MRVTIYVLIDPITLKVRYIGRTRVALNSRLSCHVCKAKRYNFPYHKDNWIRKLVRMNSKPFIRKLTEVEGWTNSYEVEKALIAKYRDRLLNHNDRGEGSKNAIRTKRQKRMISDTLKEGYKSGRIPHPRNKVVYVYDLEDNYLRSYDSCKEAAEDLNIYPPAVRKCARGIYRQMKGYQFKYKKL